MDNVRYENEENDRHFLKAHCLRNGGARYAIKTLSDHTKKDAMEYMKGLMDLAIEAKFLAVVRNANIIRMRAVADCSPFDDGYFLVLDRLYGTLDDRLSVWEKEETKAKGLMNKLSGKSKKKITKSILKRLVVAYDISGAMMHFHKINIIYRDLKPENIGFDIRDDVKIFDLGLAKEIHEEDRLPDGTYKLTGLTGSLRYMAPEVAKELPYNMTADVYSFSILLWELLALKTPFSGFTMKGFHEFVVGQGFRPPLDKSWSQSWKDLLTMSWSESIKGRPSFDDVAEILRGEIGLITGEEILDIDQSRRTAHSG